VPLNTQKDTTVTIWPQEPGVYALSPFPFAASGAEFAFGGRHISPREHEAKGDWPEVLRKAPTEWERFKLVRA
jgi:hypothetical protein